MQTRTYLRGGAVLTVWFSLIRFACAAQTPGSLDETFSPETGGIAQLDAAATIQRDGKIAVASYPLDRFLDGEGIMRFLPNGDIDQSFAIGTGADFLYGVSAIIEQTDGMLLVGGVFENFNGVPHHDLVRLNPDGSLDESFTAAISPQADIQHFALAPDGKILAGGVSFSNSVWRGYLVRLNTDGSEDTSFVPPFIEWGIAQVAATSNRVYVAGGYGFEAGDCATLLRAYRLDGTPDPTFQPAIDTNCPGTFLGILLLQPDGKLIVSYPRFAGESNSVQFARLNLDGTRDPSFQLNNTTGGARRAALTPTGKLVVIGTRSFPRGYDPFIAQFNSDGSLDTNFHAPSFAKLADGGLLRVAIQSNGQIILVGDFYEVDGFPRYHIARLNGDTPPALPTLEFSAASYTLSETQTSVTIIVIRRGELSGATSFDYRSISQTAQPGIHYGETEGQFHFVAGENNAVFTIPIYDNRLVDGSRTFSFALSNIVGATLRSNGSVLITITDDEVNNRVQFSAASFPVKETQANALIEVVRDFGSTGAVSVRYEIDDGSAHHGRDFERVSGTINFASGQFTNWFLVPIKNTHRADGNRYATLSLHDPRNGAVLGAQSNATLAILDEESPVVITTANEAWLRAATIGGGNVLFDTDGVLAMSEPIDITASTTLDARGHDIVLSGENVTRLFNVATGATLTLHGLTLANGRSTNAGAIWNDGTLVLTDCTFSNNIARGADGTSGIRGTNGLPNTNNPWVGTPGGDGGSGAPGQAAIGGAILNRGEVSAADCSFIANAVVGGNGGNGANGGDAIQFGSPGKGGDAGDAGAAQGGAVFSSGEARFKECQFFSNAALAGNPAASGVPGTNAMHFYKSELVAGSSGLSADASGGAIWSTNSITLLECRFESNIVIATAGGDGRAGNSSFGSSGGYGSAGRDGRDGGDACGGALYFENFAVGSNNLWVGNSVVAGHGGHGGPGGSGHSQHGYGVYSGGNGGEGGRGGSSSGGAIAGTGSLSLYADSFIGNDVVGGAGGNGGDGGNSEGGLARSPSAGEAGSGGNVAGGAIALRGLFEAVLLRAHSNSVSSGVGGAAASPGSVGFGYFGWGAAGAAGESGDAFGGAVFADGEISLHRSELSHNLARGSDGTNGWTTFYCGTCKLSPPDGRNGIDGATVYGGSAYLSGHITVRECTIALNAATGGDGGTGGKGAYSIYETTVGGSGGNGGDTFGAGMFLEGAAEVINSTIAMNQSRPGAGGNGGTGDSEHYSPYYSIDPTRPGGRAGFVFGSGIAIGSNSSVNLSFSTIASNNFLVATGGIGGISGLRYKAADGTGTVVLGSGINAQTQTMLRACLFAADASAPQAAGVFIDLGHNISSDASFAFTPSSSFNGYDPLIGPLADNGGPTRTMALLSGSPAIDAGDDAACPPTDQRGVPRPFGAHCDIGAFELNQPTFSISGRVKDAAGITVSAGLARSVTDASGGYTLQNLFASSYVVTPQFRNAEFSPEARTVKIGPDARNVDFTLSSSRVQTAWQSDVNGLLLRISGLPRASYMLESSTNLTDWRPFTNVQTGANGLLDVRQLVSTNQPQRYFRAR